MTTGEIRCGVVGFGMAGRIFHSAVIAATEGLALAAIVQRSGDDAAQAYPGVAVYRSVEAMLADSSIQLVAIATPNTSHAPLAEQCLRAGRHVVVDKPLAVDSAEAATLIRVAREEKRLLSVYQNRRWDGDFKTVAQLLSDGTLGELRRFDSHFDRFRPNIKQNAWREQDIAGSGVLFDLGSHLIDQALVLFGKPFAVFGDVRIERQGAQTDDAFDLRLYYPQISVWLRASCLAPPPQVRFLVEGTRGSYRKYGLDPQEDALRAGDLFHSVPWGVEPEASWGTLTFADADGQIEERRLPTLPGDYREIYRNLRDAIATDAPLAVEPVDAWRTLRILELARESSRRRSAVPCDWSKEP
jgi:scyllo-inositol 2-dehydrogenase (NADP+)